MTIIMISSTVGASVFIRVFAMVWLVCFLTDISPICLWEKNSAGMRRTCHMNCASARMASLPSIFTLYIACRLNSITCITAMPARSARKTGIHSGLRPGSSLSRNTFEKSGVMIPMMTAISDTVTVKAITAPVLFSLFFTKLEILFFLPPGSKPSAGSIIRQTPVKDLSKSSIEISTTPLAGSFITALFFLNPLSTTK